MTCQSQRKEKPPRRNPGGVRETNSRVLDFDRVAAFSIPIFGGRNCESHLLTDRARKKPAHAVRLPAGCLHQLLQSRTAGPFEQIQNLFGLGALADSFSLRRLGFLGRQGAPLGWGALLARLRLEQRNTRLPWRGVGVLGRFRLL